MSIDLRHGRWEDALRVVAPSVDALITDPPYSTRTHEGHDNAVRAARRAVSGGAYAAGRESSGTDGRRTIDYQPLSDDDARAFVAAWAPRVSGWMCILTDHVLARVFEAALAEAGRYVFAPLACVDPGSRVRLAGDGPSQWSCWLVVARPSSREWSRWGTLRGAYQRERSTAEM